MGPSLSDAFPVSARADAEIALRVLPEPELPARFDDPPVTLNGETVWIPSRIYNPEPADLVLEGLTPQRRLFVHCVLSRHSDGFVRQRHASAVVRSGVPFTIPFVAELAADYVVQVLDAVRTGMPDIGTYPSPQFLSYGRFFYENPALLELVRQRTNSFWNEHHRRALAREKYPGFALLDAFDRAVDHESKKPGRRKQQRR